MCFAETRAAIEEKWIITSAGGVDDASGGSDGEVIIAADNETIKSIFTVEAVTYGVEGFFDGLNTIFKGSDVGGGDFARADFGFAGGFNFKINIINGDAVFFKSFFNNIKEFGTELFDIKRIFNTDNDVTIGGIEKRCVLEPCGEIARRDLTLDFRQNILP